MRVPSRAHLVSVLLVGAALVFLDPLRQGTLTLLRFPFTVVKGGVAILLALPRLPALARENVELRARVMRQETEHATLREALRFAE